MAGLDGKKAKEVIELAGFKATFVVGRAAPSAAQSAHVEQTAPRAGTLATKGDAVQVTLFAAAKTLVQPGITISVVGLTVASAKQQLETKGLRFQIALGKPAPRKQDEYAVYEQTPASLADAKPGESVRLTIYGPAESGIDPPAKVEGGKVAVPNVLKLSHTEAKRVLEGQGFKVRFELGDRAPSPAQEFNVYRVSPTVGNAALRGETITLTIYSKRD